MTEAVRVEERLTDEQYTPSDLSVKIAFTYVEDGQSDELTRDRASAFDHWLFKHDEAVRAEALRVMAGRAKVELGTPTSGHTSTHSVRKWLTNEADRIEKGHGA